MQEQGVAGELHSCRNLPNHTRFNFLSLDKSVTGQTGTGLMGENVHSIARDIISRVRPMNLIVFLSVDLVVAIGGDQIDNLLIALWRQSIHRG